MPGSELKQATTGMIDRMWPEERGAKVVLEPSEKWSDALPKVVYDLPRRTTCSVQLKEQATEMVDRPGPERWLLYEQAETSVSQAMLLVVVLWLGGSLPEHRALRPAQCHGGCGADAVGGFGVRRHLSSFSNSTSPMGGVIASRAGRCVSR